MIVNRTLILLILFHLINSKQVFHLNETINHRVLDPKHYLKTANEKLVIVHSDAFSINIGDGQDAAIFDDNQAQESVCKSHQKSIQLDQFHKRRVPHTDNIYYTDMLILNQRILLIRNDLTLTEINSQITELKLNIIGQHQHFIHNQQLNRVHIITEQAALSFDDSINMDSEQFKLEQEHFIPRDIIYGSYCNANYLYVASGSEGIDIYAYDQRKLKYIQTRVNLLTYQLFVVEIRGYNESIYILDKFQGLFITDTSFNVILQIPIQNAQDFDFYENTFFIVAESKAKQDYVQEIFVDFDKKEYYLNNIYIDQMQIYDVRVFQEFAILIGYDAHQIVYHSIYSKSTKQQKSTYFYAHLLQAADINSNNQLITLSKADLVKWNVSYIPCKIECQSEFSINDKFQVQVNVSNKISNITMIQYNFTLVVQQNSLLNSTNTHLIFAVTIGLIILVGLIFLINHFHKRSTKGILRLEEQRKKLQIVSNFEKSSELGLELTSI